MLKQFLRKKVLQERWGLSASEFERARADGRISAPDAWLGPRQPVWLEETAARDQERLIARGRPLETRPTRRRAAPEATA
jgi:hypothetical protein